MTNDSGTADYVEISLSRNDIGQILDGLEVLTEQWNATGRFMEVRETQDGQIIRECSDAGEARSIADCYRRIQTMILDQV